MTGSRRLKVRPTLLAFGLLALSLLLMLAGRFIQFDDTSGFGSDDWNWLFALPALAAANGAVVVAAKDPLVRRPFGLGLGVLDALLVWQATTNDGFRFIWTSYDGELFLMLVAVALTSLVFVATGGDARPGNAGRWLQRVTAYTCLTVGLVFVAFYVGVVHFEMQECGGGDEDGECDLAILGGYAYAFVTLVAAVVAAVVCEIVLMLRRRARRRAVVRTGR